MVTSDGPIYESFAFFRVLQSALKMYIAIEKNIFISVCLGGFEEEIVRQMYMRLLPMVCIQVI